MRRRFAVIKQPVAKISIEQTQQQPDVWDSTLFDMLPRELYVKFFERAHQQHRVKLAQIAASRLGFDTAVTNVQNALNTEVGADTLQLLPDQEKRSEEQAYAMALRWYVYNHVLGIVVDDDTRKGILNELAQLVNARPAASAPGNEAPSALKHRSTDIEGSINALSRQMDKLMGAPTPERKPKADKKVKPFRPIPAAPRKPK